MADAAWVPARESAFPADSEMPRHSALVRVTHWITTLCFFALLVTGFEIVISHPRFYWGETGNVLPDQNGWSRYLHFQAAWALVLTGLLYVAAGIATRHFRRNLVPAKRDFSLGALAAVIASHLRLRRPDQREAWSYNPLQRLTYLLVIFILFPLIIWTGLAMSPAFVSAVPAAVTTLGGQQSARTIHFFVTLVLLLFLLIHLAMICLAGFRNRMRAMIIGRGESQEHL